jgi:hypothetical protein
MLFKRVRGSRISNMKGERIPDLRTIETERAEP